MKFTTYTLSALSFAALAKARPTKTAARPTDVDILNFALTLEHLEEAFYVQGLQQFPEQAFVDAGYPSWVRGRYLQIHGHEMEHVKFLSGALGRNAVHACQYNFPYSDIKGWIKLSNMLENVGGSAYAGAAKYIHKKEYLEAAASILSVENRHTAWIDVPLDLNQVWTIASALIESCPSSNPTLPVHSFLPLTAMLESSTATSVTLSFNAPTDKPLFAAFLGGGADGVSSPIINNGNGRYTAAVPEGQRGYVYVIVSDSPTSVADEHTVAGPAVVEFTFDAANNLD